MSRRKRRLSKPRKTRLSRVGGLKAHLVDWLQFRTALSLVLSAADSKIKLPAGNVSCNAPSRMARQDWGTWTTCLSCDNFHIFVNSCCHIFSLRRWRCCDIGLVARFRLPRNDKPEIRWKTAREALQGARLVIPQAWNRGAWVGLAGIRVAGLSIGAELPRQTSAAPRIRAVRPSPDVPRPAGSSGEVILLRRTSGVDSADHTAIQIR